jgi:hypothetical protein
MAEPKVDASDLAEWLAERCDGNPADALSALAIVTADLLKCAPDPAHTRDTWVMYLDRAMALPRAFFTVDEERPS